MEHPTSASSTIDDTRYLTALQSVVATNAKGVDIAASPESSSTLSSPDDYRYDLIAETEVTNIHSIPISVGGFGDVFIGEHRTTGPVALKRLHVAKDQEHIDEQLRRAFREAKTWQELKHPNVLLFLGILLAHDNVLYLVSPYVKNGSVTGYLRHNPNADRPRLLMETAAALVYLHENNIIHGDIKASNILVSDDVHALLCDFGLARPTTDMTSLALKGAGTLRWQSPERAEPDSRKTFESDVYAFGITIYEVLSGRVPFYNLDSFRVVVAILRGQRPPTDPTHSPQGLSYAPVWGVAVDCWGTDPNRRPTIQEAHRRLGSSSMSPEALGRSEGLPSPTCIKETIPPKTSDKPVRSSDQHAQATTPTLKRKAKQQKPLSAEATGFPVPSGQQTPPPRILGNGGTPPPPPITPRKTHKPKQASLPHVVSTISVASKPIRSKTLPDAPYMYNGPLLHRHSRPAPNPYEALTEVSEYPTPPQTVAVDERRLENDYDFKSGDRRPKRNNMIDGRPPCEPSSAPEGFLGPLQPEEIASPALSHMTDEGWADESDLSPSLYPKAPFVPGLYRAVKAFDAKDEGERSLSKGEQTWCDMPGGGPGQGWVIASEIVGRELRYALVPEAFLELVDAF